MVPRQAVAARAVPAVMRINVPTAVVPREDLDHPRDHLPILLAAHPAVHLVVVEINEVEYLGYSDSVILNETVTRPMEIAGKEDHMRSDKFTPYLSFIGFGLVILTLSVHISFKLGIEKGLEEGSLMLLSVANAVLLVYPLAWGVFAVLEFYMLWKEKQKLKSKLERGKMNKEEYLDQIKKVKTSLGINISYIVILLFQLGYVIVNWDEVNI